MLYITALLFSFFFFNDTATTEIYTLSLHDALPICAKYLALAEKEGLVPAETHDLSALRTILSTGSPLAGHSYDYVYGRIKRDVHLCNISGGTEIISCFAIGNPTEPVWRDELQAPGLGTARQVFDPRGAPLVGTAGELVCTKPVPSMPMAFWNDTDGAKYRAAYFERYPRSEERRVGKECRSRWSPYH